MEIGPQSYITQGKFFEEFNVKVHMGPNPKFYHNLQIDLKSLGPYLGGNENSKMLT